MYVHATKSSLICCAFVIYWAIVSSHYLAVFANAREFFKILSTMEVDSIVCNDITNKLDSVRDFRLGRSVRYERSDIQFKGQPF